MPTLKFREANNCLIRMTWNKMFCHQRFSIL